MSLLIRDVDLTMLIITFVWRHSRDADFMSPAFCSRDAGHVSLRRDADLTLLTIASVR